MSLIPKRGTVYVVDDDEAVRDSLQWLLEGKDYRVKCFDSAESFLARFDPREVACLIADITWYLIGRWMGRRVLRVHRGTLGQARVGVDRRLRDDLGADDAVVLVFRELDDVVDRRDPARNLLDGRAKCIERPTLGHLGHRGRHRRGGGLGAASLEEADHPGRQQGRRPPRGRHPRRLRPAGRRRTP